MVRISKRMVSAIAAAFAVISVSGSIATAGPKTYVYDNLGRLNSVTNSDGSIVTYTYDGADNRLSIAVTAAGPPVLVNESGAVQENSTNNEFGLNQVGGGAATGAAVVTQPAHGTTSVSGAHIYYTPTANYTGPDSYQYRASNGSGTSNTVTASFNVVLIAPRAAVGTATVAYNSTNNPISLHLSGGSATSVSVTSQASHGTSTASGLTISYTPAAGYSGFDQFFYNASNAAGTSGSVEIDITVRSQPPIAGAVSTLVAPNSVTNGIAPILTGGAAASVAVSSAPAHGAVSVSGLYFSYTPTSGYIGSDSFLYTASNSGGASAPATVSITILAAPTTGYSSTTVAYGSSNNVVPLSLGGGAPTSVAIAGQAAHGTATVSGTTILYTPAVGYSGSDNFQYNASNAAGTSSAGNVAITINPQLPIVGPVSTLVGPNSSGNGITPALSGGATSYVSVVGGPAHGSVSISGPYFSYTPAGGYEGSDAFQYTATNSGGTSAAATVSITVLGAPVTYDSATTVSQNTYNNPSPLYIGGSGVSGVTVAEQASHGTATVTGPASIVYTPYGGYTGSDGFRYTASNAAGTSQAATVYISVTPPPPVANSVSMTVTPNSVGDGISPNLSGGTASSVAVTSGPSHGSVSVSGLYFSYTPSQGFSGYDSFTYNSSNAGGTSASASVTIYVGGPTPIPQPTYQNIPENCQGCGFGAGISGTYYPNLTITRQPAHGYVTSSGPYFSYYAEDYFVGTVTFDYAASNENGASNPATVTINVSP